MTHVGNIFTYKSNERTLQITKYFEINCLDLVGAGLVVD